jgi:hypothetical protein
MNCVFGASMRMLAFNMMVENGVVRKKNFFSWLRSEAEKTKVAAMTPIK